MQTSHFIEGNRPDVLRCLANPGTMGVLWHNPWSPQSMICAQQIATLPKLNKARRKEVTLDEILLQMQTPESEALRNDLCMVHRLFKSLSDDLLPGSKIQDSSRVEPAFGDAKAFRNGTPHVDNFGLIALGILAGLTSKCVPCPVAGSYDEYYNFTPEDPDYVERMAITIPNNSLAVMKRAKFPGVGALKGLLHFRPNALLEKGDQTATRHRSHADI